MGLTFSRVWERMVRGAAKSRRPREIRQRSFGTTGHGFVLLTVPNGWFRSSSHTRCRHL
jgi:hypothetical protein